MAIVSRLELNHPALGTAGGPALHASIEALYQKIGDSVSSRWFSIQGFNETVTVDLDHNFQTDASLLQVDIMQLVGGEWEKADASLFTVIEKAGEEGTVLQVTNDSAGNGIDVAVSVVFNPIFLSDGDIKDIDISSVLDKDLLVYDSVTKKFVTSDTLDGKTIKNAVYGEESLAAATTIAPANVIVRVTSGVQIDMIDPTTTKLLVLTNVSGGDLTLMNLTGATSDHQIITGTDANLLIPENSSVSLVYDSTSLKWRVYGGSGSGSVGGQLERTTIPLSDNATSTVQNFAAFDASELFGWVYINAATSYRFYVSCQVSKTGDGSDYNVSYQVSGDAPPVGFDVEISASGLLSVTLPSEAGFVSAEINYSLNVATDTVALPLSIDANNLTGTISTDRLLKSDLADSSEQYLLPRIQTEVKSLDNQYTGGSVRIERIANTVTITSNDSATHAALQSALTSVGFLPVWARPTATKLTNVYGQSGSVTAEAGAYSDGKLGTEYTNTTTGAGFNATNTVGPILITYCIY